MRLPLLLGLLFPAALFGSGAKVPTRVPVRVGARIPLIAAVEGPSEVVLAPGEVAHIKVSVLANVPWILVVHSQNACVPGSTTLSGPPGGMIANTHDVDICCSSEASGQQTIALIYTLMPR